MIKLLNPKPLPKESKVGDHRWIKRIAWLPKVVTLKVDQLEGKAWVWLDYYTEVQKLESITYFDGCEYLNWKTISYEVRLYSGK